MRVFARHVFCCLVVFPEMCCSLLQGLWCPLFSQQFSNCPRKKNCL